MRILKAFSSLIVLYAVAAPVYAQSSYGYVGVTDETDDGVPEQVNTPQGLVVISNLVGNGVWVLVENRSWQRVTFKHIQTGVGCAPIPPQAGSYYVSDPIGPITLESTQSFDKNIECMSGYKAYTARVDVLGALPTFPARSAPLFPSTAQASVTIADYSYDSFPVRVNEANNVQLEAFVRNRTAEFRVRNRGAIPVRINRLVAQASCGTQRPAGMSFWVTGDSEVTQVLESRPANELWIAAGTTFSLVKSCPTGLLAKSASFSTSLD